jgi:hypothetical protein
MANKNSGVKSSFAEGAGLTERNKPCPSGFYRNKAGKCVQKGVGKEYKP